MIKNKNQPTVDLTGPEGNAFCLLGYAHRWARELDLDWSSIEKDATSGDYEHLVSVLDKHFGKYVIFLR
jgi:hypothetical protein